MTITVVIPALNEERMLPDTLARAACQGFDEILVVDGGSTDRTTDIVTRQQRVSASQPLGLSARTPITLMIALPGRARQMNAGAALVRSDVLVFLHADTLLPPNARAVIEDALRDPGCVGGRFDVRFQPDGRLGKVIGTLMNWRSRWTGIATGDQALFVRRSVFEQLRGFPDIPIMEDIEFTRRLKRAGSVAALRTPVITSYRRWETGGPMRTIVLMWTLRLLYWLGVSPNRLHHLYGTVR